jgi:hypothetical protein
LPAQIRGVVVRRNITESDEGSFLKVETLTFAERAKLWLPEKGKKYG